jgi:hypothetical protein
MTGLRQAREEMMADEAGAPQDADVMVSYYVVGPSCKRDVGCGRARLCAASGAHGVASHTRWGVHGLFSPADRAARPGRRSLPA